MGFLNRQHVAEATTSAKIVKWDEQAGAFTYSKRVGTEFKQMPVTEPFAIDIWQTQHGWETWVESNGSRSRQVVLASVNQPVPPKPDGKPMAIYCVPVGSRELGGRRDLIVKGKEPTAAFCDLYDTIAAAVAKITAEHGEVVAVPIVEVAVKATDDFGNAPVFDIIEWDNRPQTWGPTIVKFDA
jgi:hypothetical protein